MSNAPFTWSNTAMCDMPGQTTARAFETCVEEILLTRGGWKSSSAAYQGIDDAVAAGIPHRPHHRRRHRQD